MVFRSAVIRCVGNSEEILTRYVALVSSGDSKSRTDPVWETCNMLIDFKTRVGTGEVFLLFSYTVSKIYHSSETAELMMPLDPRSYGSLVTQPDWKVVVAVRQSSSKFCSKQVVLGRKPRLRFSWY